MLDDLYGYYLKKIVNSCEDYGEELIYYCRMCVKVICKFCRKDLVYKGYWIKFFMVVMDIKC